MATTGVVIQALASGVINTSTGAALASGKVRFYQPGTLIAQNVYSDDACSTAISQPYTLGSGGEAKLFMLDPVRMIVKDSTDTTTHLDTVVIQRHDQQYITHTDFNSGAETTLEALLSIFSASLGTNLQYKVSTGATARSYQARLAQDYVSVRDFAADNTGVNDAKAAFTSAIDEAIDNGCKRVYVPEGIYRIDTPITAIDTAGLEIWGVRGESIIRNHGTTTNLFTVNVSGDSRLYMHDLTLTCNTTSSAAAVAFTAGDRAMLERVSVLLHRTGISAATPSGTIVRDCIIESTDDNASAVGITVGPRGRVDDCEVISGTDNGSGIVLGADARATDCYVNNFATAYLLSGARSRARGCIADGSTTGATLSGAHALFSEGQITACTTGASLTGADATIRGTNLVTGTTGISLGAARTGAMGNVVTSFTTGITVGAFASCRVIDNAGATNTTGLSINASATLLVEHGNPTITPVSDSALTPHTWLRDRGKVYRETKQTIATATPSFTPTPSTCDIFICESTYAAANTTATIGATATTGLVNGQEFRIVIYKNAANNITSTTFDAQYGTSPPAAGSIANGGWCLYTFKWHAATSIWNVIHAISTPVAYTSGTTYW